MTLKEIEQKKDYLNSLRKLTLEEKEILHNYIIKKNTSLNPRQEETIGIANAYNFLNYVMKEESYYPYPKGYRHPINEDFLKSLNQIILLSYSCYLPCEKGCYRRGCNAKINERILPSYEVFIPRLKELIHQYKITDSDLISKLAYFHLEFLTEIHPFYDGNGRTARAFMNLELARLGYPMIGLKNHNIDIYYKTFTAYIEQKDKKLLEQLILEAIDSELERQILIRSR